MTGEDEPAFDPSVVIEAISTFLLGEAPSLSREDVAELSGLPPEITRQRWRALGFPKVPDGVVAFTHADVDALRLTQSLIDLGVIRPESEQAFIRTIGRMASARDARFGHRHQPRRGALIGVARRDRADRRAGRHGRPVRRGRHRPHHRSSRPGHQDDRR